MAFPEGLQFQQPPIQVYCSMLDLVFLEVALMSSNLQMVVLEARQIQQLPVQEYCSLRAVPISELLLRSSLWNVPQISVAILGQRFRLFRFALLLKMEFHLV